MQGAEAKKKRDFKKLLIRDIHF